MGKINLQTGQIDILKKQKTKKKNSMKGYIGYNS